MGILTWMTFLPLVGAAVILCLPSRADELIKRTALAFTLPPLVMGIWLFQHFDRATTAFQYVQHAPWIESYPNGARRAPIARTSPSGSGT